MEALGNLIKDCSEKFDLKEKQLRESAKELALKMELESSIQELIDAYTKSFEDKYKSSGT